MSKASARKSSHTGQFQTKHTAADELATFRSVVTALKGHPDQLRSIVTKAGITTPAGNLKKAYKG